LFDVQSQFTWLLAFFDHPNWVKNPSQLKRLGLAWGEGNHGEHGSRGELDSRQRDEARFLRDAALGCNDISLPPVIANPAH
jgi:hypothetical protein